LICKFLSAPLLHIESYSESIYPNSDIRSFNTKTAELIIEVTSGGDVVGTSRVPLLSIEETAMDKKL
jgi:hypothetical protein